MRIGFCRAGDAASRGELASKACDSVVEGGISALLGAVTAGDVVVVSSLATLGPTPRSAVRAATELRDSGCDIVLLQEGIDTSDPEHSRFFEHARAVADVGERAGARTHTGGKPRADASAVARAVGMYESGEYKVAEIVAVTGVSRSTLYRSVDRQASGDP